MVRVLDTLQPYTDLMQIDEDSGDEDVRIKSERREPLAVSSGAISPKHRYIEPMHSIHYQPGSLSMRICCQLIETAEHAELRPRLARKIESTYLAAYTTPAHFENYNKRGNETFMFRAGTYALPLTCSDPAALYSCLRAENYDTAAATARHYIYESFVKWSPHQLDYTYRPLYLPWQRNKTPSFNEVEKFHKILHNADERAFYLLTDVPEHEGSHARSFISTIEKNELVQSLVSLATANRIYLVFKDVDMASVAVNGSRRHKLFINVDVFLNDSLKCEEFVSQPSESVRATELPVMHTLVNFFFPEQTSAVSLNDQDRTVSGSGGKRKRSDEHYDSDSDSVDNDDPFLRCPLSKRGPGTASTSPADDTVLESKFSSENLFDLVYELRQEENLNTDLNDPGLNAVIQVNSCLRPVLRPYQIRAIRWMLQREQTTAKASDSENNDETNLHPLYRRITNADAQIIYYHKHYGMFCTEGMPRRAVSYPGGILADEMGLGKTLEVLAMILINRNETPAEVAKIEPLQRSGKEKKRAAAFSCLCGEAPSQFNIQYDDSDTPSSTPETPSKSPGSYTSRKKERFFAVDRKVDSPCYPCVGCGVFSHPECLNYHDEPEFFLCLKCCTDQKPIKSGCTLVVTPATISHQWADEIRKHVGKKLRVKIYDGTQNGFIQPRDLAKYDIVITTYEVLSSELKHVFAFENMRELRRPKRFMNVPCPLINVEWWRICLDEAQMVHSTNTHCAEMAERLPSVNRWCITGTPIGRSLADLHGLFSFIRADPYCDRRWFDCLLYEPFKGGDRLPMARATSDVLWRTAKRFVENEIEIPAQTERVFWLDFSSFESHLYQRVIESFRQHRKNCFDSTASRHHDMEVNDGGETSRDEAARIDEFFSQFVDSNSKIDEMDRRTLDQLLSPLLDLRLTCNHPQLVLRRSTFNTGHHAANRQTNLLTMDQSLKLLMNKTQSESDRLYRLLVKNLNTQAGLRIIKDQPQIAIELYEKVLTNKREVLTDVRSFQVFRAHTLFNYMDLIKQQGDLSDEAAAKFDELETQLEICEQAYMQPCTDATVKSRREFSHKRDAVHAHLKELEKDKADTLDWCEDSLRVIENDRELLERWEVRFEETFSRFIIFGTEVHTGRELMDTVRDKLNDVLESREQLLESLVALKRVGKEMAQRASQCHLKHSMYKRHLDELTGNAVTRPNQSRQEALEEKRQMRLDMERELAAMHRGVKCDLCTVDQHIKSYSACLLALNSQPFVVADGEDESTAVHSTTGTSDLEIMIRLFLHFSRYNEALKVSAETGKRQARLFELMKEEMRAVKSYWAVVSNEIQAYDELEINRVRVRLLADGEQNLFKENLLVKRGEVELCLNSLIVDEQAITQSLAKKTGQLLFLQNSLKSNSIAVGEENKEMCPICQSHLGFDWSILACGHVFCSECYIALTRQPEYTSKVAGKDYIKCPMCRESVLKEETSHVSTRKLEVKPREPTTGHTIKPNHYDYSLAKNELAHIRIKGDCNSAKVEGIVRCLVKILHKDPEAKCLVFSEHTTMLEMISNLLSENEIQYFYARTTAHLKKNIDSFKNEADTSVLLMPYSFGANGLNIIEATHVLLVEPTLNKSQEVQAIGRVHRIGQTKPTFVYRFLVRNTIEELVYSLFKSNSSYSNAGASSSATASANYPNTSRSFERLDSGSNQSAPEKVIKINDLKELFLNL